jgi:O-antigen ligase
MLRSFSKIRFGLICFAAVALGLPITFISLAKLALLLALLVVLLHAWWRPQTKHALAANATTPAVLLALALIALSALWSTGSSEEAAVSFAKHGRLIMIPVLLYLVRSRREALFAVACFVAGQIFLLGSSWLLFLGLDLPWVTSNEAGSCEFCSFAVHSSYLDQSIMSAVLAAICWHLRVHLAPRYRLWLALPLALLALACVFFVFQGRTGHLIALALISLTLLWELPRRFKLAALLVPLLMLLGLAASSAKVGYGLTEIGHGLQSSRESDDVPIRSGVRLDLWYRSLHAMAQSPWLGTGVGSWNRESKRQVALHARDIPVNSASGQQHNPHQEYLLWGVELGLIGIALLCALLLALYRDSLRLAAPQRRAMQSVLLALGIACLFNCALYDAMIGDFFCITLGLLAALGTPAAATGVSGRNTT